MNENAKKELNKNEINKKIVKNNSVEEFQRFPSKNKKKINKNLKNTNNANDNNKKTNDANLKQLSESKNKNNQYKKEEKNNDEIDEILKDKVIKKEMPNCIQKVLENYNLMDDDILIKNPKQLTINLYYTMKHLLDAEHKLKKQNIILDKALQDIVHKIEGDKFNVVEGYKLAKKIQIIRNKKSLIRESLILYEKLNGLGLNIEDNINNLSKIIIDIENQNKRIEYKPKVLKDLEFRYDNEIIYKKYEDIKKDDLKTIGIDEIY